MEEKTNNTNNKKKIKGCILTILLFVVCCGLTLYICELYKVHEQEKKKTPIIQGMISEIYGDDLEHYIADNQTTVVYVCAANDEDCRSFEREFKKLLKTNNYNEQLVYLNLTDMNQDSFVESFNNTYPYKVKLTTNYPAFILFEDGKVKSILQENSKKLSVVKVKNFLELIELGE